MDTARHQKGKRPGSKKLCRTAEAKLAMVPGKTRHEKPRGKPPLDGRAAAEPRWRIVSPFYSIKARRTNEFTLFRWCAL
jgi:hypothetical protein